MTTQLSLVLLCSSCLLACGSNAKKSTATPQPAPATAALPAPAATASAAASPNVGVSGDLVAQCKLRFSHADRAPTFDYNDTELLEADRAILQQVANCLTKGPLHDKRVQLVGRADPRGTDEYNLGIGSRRAETVRSYLQRLGVPAARLTPTTRGEIDAAGTNEVGWQRDRRVDLELVN